MTTTILVSLLDEGTAVWRPVDAEHLRDDIYRIVGSPADETEKWQFAPGSVVRCREHTFSAGEKGVVAFEQFSADTV